MSATPALYVWQELEPEGLWGTIAAVFIPGLEAAPLVTRSREIAANQFAGLAEAHQQASGRPVRLARYDFARELRRIE